MKPTKLLIILLFVFLMISCKQAPKEFVANYDEANVPRYDLPDPLMFQNGKPVADSSDWYSRRRPEILKLFEEEVYGKVPGFEYEEVFVLDECDSSALDGSAIRKQVTIKLIVRDKSLDINLLIYQPKSREPVPAFVGYNFNGNHATNPDTAIFVTSNWVMNNEELGITDNKASAGSRGANHDSWPAELIVQNGCAVATVYYGDIDPDYDDGFRNGVHGLIYDESEQPARDEWGSIAAWAWGLSRIMDYLETDPSIISQKVAVIGHSRLGKTALWAGALDERFAIVISNNSGCGGAALSKRIFGETVGRINTSFPHWFCDNFNKYNMREKDLPVDQHMLIALIAPRPVYIASATEDLWADPKGEFLAGQAADTVYRFLGIPGLAIDAMPESDQPSLDGNIGYHLRTGKHALTPWDWEQYLKFAKQHFHPSLP